MKKFCGAMMVMVLVMAFSACTSSQSGPTPTMSSAPVMYNKYNLHVHYKNSKDVKASYANWTGPYPGHRVIPPGTPMRVQRSARGFLLERADNGDIINFVYSEQKMNMDKPTYMDKIFSSQKVSLDHL